MGSMSQQIATHAARPFAGHAVTTLMLKRLQAAVHKATGLPVKCDRENNWPIPGRPIMPVQIAVLDPAGWFILWLNQDEPPAPIA